MVAHKLVAVRDGMVVPKERVERIIEQALGGLDYEPAVRPLKKDGAPGNLLKLPSDKTTYVIGDIHANVANLRLILTHPGIRKDLNMNRACLLFLGDLIHPLDNHSRADASLKTLLTILTLMRQYPDRLFLLRGNHETILDTLVKKKKMVSYIFNEQIRSLYGDATLRMLGTFFGRLPVIAAGQGFVAAHAGPPTHPACFERIVNAGVFDPEYTDMYSGNRYTASHVNQLKAALGHPDDSYVVVGHHALADNQSIDMCFRGLERHIALQSHHSSDLQLIKMEQGIATRVSVLS